jgi:hypothetical protein
VFERVAQVDARRDRRRVAEHELLHDPRDGRGIERLLQHRQYLQAMLVADAPDMFEHRRAAAAHELDEAEIAALGEHQDGFDRLARIQPDIEKHELGVAPRDGRRQCVAVGEFFGVEAGAVQDERKEMADAAVLVDDIADRHADARSCAIGRPWDGSVRRCAFQTVRHPAAPPPSALQFCSK